jgi:hypothetical protein
MKQRSFMHLKFSCIYPFALAMSLAVVGASAQSAVLFPTADLRVLDMDGDGVGDTAHAEDSTHLVLNVGDNRDNQVWRSVLKFDLSAYAGAVESAETIELKLNVRNRLLAVPKDWKIKLIAFDSSSAKHVSIGGGAGNDDFSAPPLFEATEPAGQLKEGAYWTINVTELAKSAARSNGTLALRLELDPGTNYDSAQDQVSFYAGSHGVNSPQLRPQLVLLP